MKHALPAPELSFSLSLQPDAKALAKARSDFASALADLERLPDRIAELRRDEAEALQAGSLDDPSTFRAVADIRTAIEMAERKLAQFKDYLAEAGPALNRLTRQFIRNAEPKIAALKVSLIEQRGQLRQYALDPFRAQFDWLDAAEAQLDQLTRLFPDLDWSPGRADLEFYSGSQLKKTQQLLDSADQAAMPLPTPPPLPES